MKRAWGTMFCVCCAACVSAGGPLTPPAGPVAESYKTLGEVEPRIPIGTDTTPGDATRTHIISMPGSYYLTGNVTGESGKVGIEITGFNVRLDLNGFVLEGVGGSLQGIRVSIDGAHIINGTVTGWEGTGVEVGGFNSDIERIDSVGNSGYGFELSANVRVTDCTSVGNGQPGFFAPSNAVTFTRCLASANAGAGFRQGSHCVYVDCIAQANQSDGFDVGEKCRFVRCDSSQNGFAGGGDGFTGIGSGHSLESCNASNNNGHGFNLAGTLVGCVAEDNFGVGFSLGSGSGVATCKSISNDLGGFDLGARSTITGSASRLDAAFGISTADNCVVQNCAVGQSTGSGVAIGSGCVAIGCTVSENADGIVGGSDCLIEACAVTSNTGDGIRCSTRSTIRGNQCSLNGNGGLGAGIMVSGQGNRIEDNALTQNGNGIETTTNRNVIVKNTLYLNSAHFALGGGQTVVSSSASAPGGPWDNLTH